MSRIFLSHSSTDNGAAVALRDWLKEEGWDDVFLDVDPERGIAAGERRERKLYESAQRCEAVLFLVSKAWLASSWCLREFDLAHRLNRRLFGVLIEDIAIADLPVNLTGTWQLVRLGAGRDHIMRRATMPVTGTEVHVTFSAEGLVRLRAGLRRAGLDPRFFDWPPEHDPDRPPYRGLRPLEAEDAGIFFGREAPIVEALDRVRGMRDTAPPRLLVILGASGAGKSSFLRAGVLPHVARDDRNFVALPVIRPEPAAIDGESGLVRALEAACRSRGIAQTRAAIRDAVAGGAETLRPMLEALVETAQPPPIPDQVTDKPPLLVLPIDQGEELFLREGGDQATALLALLCDLLLGDAPNVLVLVTMRSDSYERMQTARALDGIRQETLSLPPMPHGAYQAVIEGPAARLKDTPRALDIDPALTQALLVDIETGGGRDALPLLAFTMERLYLEYGASRRLALDNYEALGRIRGSIEEAVERALKTADADPRIPRDRDARLTLLRRGLIPWLVGIDLETKSPRRQIARLAEIPAEARPLIDLLVQQRLLATDRAPDTGEVTIEPAHEALLRQWGSLRDWLDEDFGALATLENVERAARDWAANGRDPAWLAHMAGRLEEAERLNLRPDLAAKLTPTERDYLAACRARAEAERKEKENALAREQARLAQIAEAQAQTETAQARTRRQQRWTFVTIGVAVLAIAIGLGVGWWQIDLRQRALDKAVTLLQADQRELSAANTELDARRRALDEEHVNLLAQLAGVERLRDDRDGGLRFAVHAAALGLKFDSGGKSTPLVGAELAAAVSYAGWQLVFSGHWAAVSFAAFSPDGMRIVTASWDHTARIWDATTGKQIVTLLGHGDGVLSAAFSPDGKHVVTASADNTARIWDATTGNEIAVLRGLAYPVYHAAFSPDGSRIVTASADNTARIWDVATAKEIAVLPGHEGPVDTAAFSPDGSRIVTASYDGTARIWDAATANEIAVLRGHGNRVNSAAFSPDGKRIVTASYDQTARIWDAASAKEIAVLRGHQDRVFFAGFSPDGSRIVTASLDGTARIWDVITVKQLAVLRGHERELFSAAFSPDGSRIVTASYDKTARIWDAAVTKEIAILRGHGGIVNSAAFSPDGKSIMTVSSDNSVLIWDAGTAKQKAVLNGHEGGVTCAAFSPDGSRVVSASRDDTARLWNFTTIQEILVLAGHEDEVLSVAFSPDGKRIVTASKDDTARIWDPATARQIAVLRGHQDWVNSAAFSPDGKRIVTASKDETARI